jgi:hypothetical protein
MNFKIAVAVYLIVLFFYVHGRFEKPPFIMHNCLNNENVRETKNF